MKVLSPSQKIFLLLSIFICTGLFLNGALGVLSFDKKHSEFTAEKLTAIALNVKQPLEYGLALGLGLSEMTQLDDLLEQVIGKHDSIDFVGIVDADGFDVLSKKRNEKTVVPEKDFLLTEVSMNGFRKFSSGALNGIAVTLINSFGVESGYLVLTYNDNETRVATWKAGTFIVPFTVGSVIVLLLLAFLLNRKAFTKVHRLVEESEKCIDSLSHGKGVINIQANTLDSEELSAYQRSVSEIVKSGKV